MADIKTTFTLVDKFTAPLKRINKALYDSLKTMRLQGQISHAESVKMQNDLSQVNKLLLQNTQQQATNGHQINKTNKKIKEQATAWTKVKQSLVGRFALGNIIANFAWGAIYAFQNMVTSAIDYASSLVEVQNIVDVAFGKSSKEVDAWAKTTLKAYGINEMNAKKYAGTLASQIQASGIAQKNATQMAMALTGLTGDIASFRNEKIEDVYKKISSGLSGMVMPLRRYGIDLTVATMQEEMHRLGIKKKWKELAQSEKIQIRYNYLMRKTQFMQGDFTKTQYTFANQLRLVQQNWVEYTGQLASGFLPILNIILIGTNKLISFLKDFGTTWNRVMPKLLPYLIGVSAVILMSFVPAILLATKSMIILGAKAVWSAGCALVAWATANAPLAIAIATVIALIGVLNYLGVTFGQVTGVVNVFWNAMIHPIETFRAMFGSTMIFCLTLLKPFLQAMDAIRGTNWAEGAQSLISKGKDMVKPSLDRAKESYSSGKRFGTGIEDKLKQALTLQTHFDNSFDNPFGQGGDGKPDGTKSNPLHTKMDDKDIKAMVDVAKINYVNKFIKVAPQQNNTFGDIRETADVGGVLSALTDHLQTAYDGSLKK